jgi:hypothetical protein
MERDEQNFDSLKRLLALKRHEVPPPGYFDNFSREVIASIKTGRSGGPSDLVERSSWEATWFGRLWTALEARPVFAALCGMAFCGLLVSGLVLSETKSDSTAPFAIFMAPEIRPVSEVAAESAPLLGSPSVTPVGATMAPAQPGSLFNLRPPLNVQPSSHSIPPGR